MESEKKVDSVKASTLARSEKSKFFTPCEKLEFPSANLTSTKDFPYFRKSSKNNAIFTLDTDGKKLYLHPTDKAGTYKLKYELTGAAVWPETLANEVAALFWNRYDKSHFEIHPVGSQEINVYGTTTPKKLGDTDLRHKQFCHFCFKASEGKLLVCSRCKIARYCGKECQKSDWSKHKISCTLRSKKV